MLLLSLVGEQPAPNLLPLWHRPPEGRSPYTAVQFAATRTTLPVAATLGAAIAADPQLKGLEVLPPLTLEAYQIGPSRVVLANAIIRHLLDERRIRLNLTGGTKLMSLAALQAAYGTGAQLLYVSTEENCLILFQSDGTELERSPIRVRISVEQYLSAHGLEVSGDPSFQSGRVVHAAPPPKEGDELEERVARLAEESGLFDDVRRSVYIRRQTPTGTVDNQLDVVVTRNGRLAVCSCKSGVNITNEAVYELASLSRREAFGIYCRKMLVTDRPKVRPGLPGRARAMGVSLVYGDQVDQIAERLVQITG